MENLFLFHRQIFPFKEEYVPSNILFKFSYNNIFESSALTIEKRKSIFTSFSLPKTSYSFWDF